MEQPVIPRCSDAEPDIGSHCYNCGERGEWRKCKLICRNPRCGVHVLPACVG